MRRRRSPKACRGFAFKAMKTRLGWGTRGGLLLRAVLLAALFFPLCAARGDASSGERILDFSSHVTVMADSSLVVTEKIQVYAARVDIRRGIIREFPTRYNVNGKIRRVGFELVSSMLNGRPTLASVKQIGSVVEIRLGNPNLILPVGAHVFELTYRTTKQLGFFDSWDELYWNVTGNGWIFPIDRAQFTVRLPEGATMSKYDAFTGKYGGRERFFTREGAVFKTTKPLAVGEGFTVVVGWPKGFVTPPKKTMSETLIDWHVWHPLPAMACYLLFFIAVRMMMEKRYGKNGSLSDRGTVIPLFYPPDNMEPAQLRYVKKFKYDDVSNSANIIHLAVNGFLKIKEENGELYLCKGYQGDIVADRQAVLKSRSLSDASQLFLARAFENSEKVRVTSSSSELLHLALRDMERAYDRPRYRRKNPLAYLSFIILLVPLHLIMRNSVGVLLGLSTLGQVLVVFSAIASAPFFSWKYGREWGSLCDKVDGFLQYLKVAEKNRLEILYPYLKGNINVPEQTPELFERYLPYALSLDVAQTWASAFSSILERAHYRPAWYESGDGDDYFTPSMLRRLQRSTAVINRTANAYSPPKPAIRASDSKGGWGSGFGGGGFSGGGGGGGGGRGW